MTFAEADRQAMKQVMLPLDRPTPEQLGFKPDSQNWSVYKRLLHGPVSNGEILYEMRIANSTGRVSDVRKALRPYLMDVRAEHDPVDRSRVVYRLKG
jgi:hypothetical protein